MGVRFPAGFLAPQNRQKTMKNKFDLDWWEALILFVNECDRKNKELGIDPHHFEMEWNHTLPQCLFGNQPCGQWLTLRQHAIASCLQTLALRKICFCGWHQRFVPPWLWKKCHKVTESERKRQRQANGHNTHKLKLGVFNPGVPEETKVEWRRRGTEVLRATQNGFFSPKIQSAGGKIGGKVTAFLKFEDPDHPELGHHNAGNLVLKQKARGLPHGKENRRKVQ